MTQADMIFLTYLLLGVLVGLIFILDAWRSASSDDLTKSPKLKGLIAILGGSLVLAIEKFSGGDPGQGFKVYVLAVVIMALLGVVFLACFAVSISMARLQEVRPSDSRWRRFLESLVFVWVVLQDGFQAFRREIDNDYRKILRRERDRAVNFFCTASRMSPPANSSSENLCDSIESMLSAFVGLYLGDYDMTSFRCSVGIVNDNEILYLCGVSPEVRPHTKNPLPLDKSLAGVAVKNPGMTYFSGDEGVQFIKKHGNRYCAVMSCAVPGESNGESNMVVSIDCSSDQLEIQLDHVEAGLIPMTKLISNLHKLTGVTRKNLTDYALKIGSL